MLTKYMLERMFANANVYRAAGDQRQVVLDIDPRDGNFDYRNEANVLCSGLAPEEWVSEASA